MGGKKYICLVLTYSLHINNALSIFYLTFLMLFDYILNLLHLCSDVKGVFSLCSPQVFFVSDLFKPKGRRSTLSSTPLKKELVPAIDIRERSNHLIIA